MVAAYEKLGAKYVKLVRDEDAQISIHSTKEPNIKGLPGFSFDTVDDKTLSLLPRLDPPLRAVLVMHRGE